MGHEAKRCVDCGLEPERMIEESTLVSLEGWRLTRSVTPGGTIKFDWRCPTCWDEYRRNKNGVRPARPPT